MRATEFAEQRKSGMRNWPRINSHSDVVRLEGSPSSYLRRVVSTAKSQSRDDAPQQLVTVAKNHSDGASQNAPLKRCFDVVVSVIALILLTPLFVATAALIKITSPGPVFFRQPRYARDNNLFQIFKFRTMYADTQDSTGVHQTRLGDPRVTPIGKFLRRTNIDELPQLLNVIVGDMSLVGPRPHVPGMLAAGMKYEELIPYYFVRHHMRPGITGLAQISELRGSTDDARFARARIDYDLVYVQNYSFLFDLKILWTTVKSECAGGTGY